MSDITIGDFWGLGKNIPADYIPARPHGCSVILPSTERGRQIVEDISSMMNLYERTVEEAVKGNAQLNWPVPLTRQKRVFRNLFPIIGWVAYGIVIRIGLIKKKVMPQRILRFVKRKIKECITIRF